MTAARRAALENLGQLVFDPTLGYCAPLEPAGTPGSITAPGWEAASQEGISRPVRAFFRRVGLQLDERIIDERTVCPASQAWQSLALCRLGILDGEAPGREPLGHALARRCLYFVFDQLRRDDGLFAPRVYEVNATDDWLAPLPGTQALVLEAACELAAQAARVGLAPSSVVVGWVTDAFLAVRLKQAELLASGDTPELARTLLALVQMQTTPAHYHDEADYLIWSLIDRLAHKQWPDGSWDGRLRPTAEAVAALARLSAAEPALATPDALGRAIRWLASMQKQGQGAPLPMPGLRVWEYGLHDFAALLEAARQVAGVGVMHPADRRTMARLRVAWLRFAVGRRLRLPRSSRHAGMWVAGLQFVVDQRRWKREPFIEPGAVGRMAAECLLAGEDPSCQPLDERPKGSVVA